MKSLPLLILLCLPAAGCVFEPDCSTYEECMELRPTTTANGTPNGSTNVAPNSTSGSNATTPDPPSNQTTNSATSNSLPARCSLDSCPDTDTYDIGGDPTFPLGCRQFGEIEFFEFEEINQVCAGNPRNYSMYLGACDSSYIVEITLEASDGCVADAEITFDFEGFDCTQPNTRCQFDTEIPTLGFIIDPDEFAQGELVFGVDARAGGFDYLLRVRSRR